MNHKRNAPWPDVMGESMEPTSPDGCTIQMKEVGIYYGHVAPRCGWSEFGWSGWRTEPTAQSCSKFGIRLIHPRRWSRR